MADKPMSLFDFAGLAFGTYSLLENRQKARELSDAMNQQYASNQQYQQALLGLMGQREQAGQQYQAQMTDLARTAGEQMQQGQLPAETVARINGLVDYFVGGGEAVNLGILKPQFDALDGAFKGQISGVDKDRGAQMFTIANNLTGEAKTRALLKLDMDVADKKEQIRQQHLTDMANLNIKLTDQYMQWALGAKDKDAATKLQSLQLVGTIAAAGKPQAAEYGAIGYERAHADPMKYLAADATATNAATAGTGAGIMKLLGGLGKTEQPVAQKVGAGSTTQTPSAGLKVLDLGEYSPANSASWPGYRSPETELYGPEEPTKTDNAFSKLLNIK